jgi:D-alanyl-D-alanine carboxypeptidase
VRPAPPPERRVGAPLALRRRHWLWLVAGFPFAFAVPFILADTLELDRDLYYGLYVAAVSLFVSGWAWHTGLTRRDFTRNWRWGVLLGGAGAAITALIVLRTEDATEHPAGVEFIGALAWRGVVYGAADAVLLSVFPILAVFAAFAGTHLRARRSGKVAIGAIALLASVGIAAVYHLGYSDFRSAKLRKPVVGDLVWSAPTLATLSPLGAPIAHIGLHVSAVAHSYDTGTFLPPHTATAPPARSAARPELQRILDALVTGPDRIAPGATAYVRTPTWTWRGSAGLADVSTGEAMKPDARMRLESVSKIWTAAVVLRLAQDGLLRPGDTVERWLPGLLPYGDRITIAQLLTHTSGLIDNNDMLRRPEVFIARVKDPALRAQLKGVATRLRANPALVFPPLLWIKLAAWQPLRSTPGTTFHYSNIGFEILGLVVNRASGKSLQVLYRSMIFAPLELESSSYDPQGKISGPHAHGYQVGVPTGELTDATRWHGGIGAEGGIVSNAADTAHFLAGLMQAKVVDSGWVERMRTELFWTGEEPSACGSAVGHSGAGAGFKTDVRVSSSGDRVAVLLLNGRANESGDNRAGQSIWDLYCGGSTP